MLDLSTLRQEYMRDGLDENNIRPDPLEQFTAWFGDAVNADLPMPNAMALSTVSRDHRPSSRTVLLKGVDHGGFVFYTSYHSRKGRDIESPHDQQLSRSNTPSNFLKNLRGTSKK